MYNTIVNVSLEDKSYPIHIGQGLLKQTGQLISSISKLDYVIVITDSNVATKHLPTIKDSLQQHGINIRLHTIPAGEKSKSISLYGKIIEDILAERIERNSVIIALGGGVVGDLTGFIASSLLRGIKLVQIPTTLLSQVDSSVGGKTGINSSSGKNLIGAFYQPSMVIADTDTLKTLPKREISSGYAEIVKYGCIQNSDFFKWLESNGKDVIAMNNSKITHAIKLSCEIKAKIVSQDEKENGVRAILNLGHTFGHALENAVEYNGTLLHGEAVSIGMILAYKTAIRLNLASNEDLERLINLLTEAELPIKPTNIDFKFDVDSLIKTMYKDKKVVFGEINFVMPRFIGDSFVTKDIDMDLIKSIWLDALKEN